MSKNYCKDCNKKTRTRPANANGQNVSDSPPIAPPSPNGISSSVAAYDLDTDVNEPQYVVITPPFQTTQSTQTGEPKDVFVPTPGTPQATSYIIRSPPYEAYALPMNNYNTHPTCTVPTPMQDTLCGGSYPIEQPRPPHYSHEQLPLAQHHQTPSRHPKHNEYQPYGRPAIPELYFSRNQRGRSPNPPSIIPGNFPANTNRAQPIPRIRPEYNDSPSESYRHRSASNRRNEHYHPSQTDYDEYFTHLTARLARLQTSGARAEQSHVFQHATATTPRFGVATQPAQQGAGQNAQQIRSVFAFGAEELDNDTVEYCNSDESAEEKEDLMMRTRGK
jgi:hypothetical protein